ncbi:MAG: excalibur calcium-binding domain-containing protein [Thermomonas hydrothermalis]|nr:excalibur calcium-binding domain-containing protein [Thermomonas hydrothermalis]
MERMACQIGERSVKLKTFVLLVAAGVGGLAAYDHFRPRLLSADEAVVAPAPRRPIVVDPNPVEDRSWIKPREGTPTAEAASPYQCDGRTMCSQMRSCEEAKYFLQHCPGPQMDGDNDGIPCEQQWCS